MLFFKSLFVAIRQHTLAARRCTCPACFYKPSVCKPSSLSFSTRKSARLVSAVLGLMPVFIGHPFIAANADSPLSSKQETFSRSASLSRSAVLPSAKVDKGSEHFASTTSLQLTISIPGGHSKRAKTMLSNGPSQAIVNFGTVSFLAQPQVSRIFTLCNNNKVPVTISQLQSSCGGLTASFNEVSSSTNSKQTLSSKESASLHKTLLAGQQVSLNVNIQGAVMMPGEVNQSVLILIEGQAVPAAVIKVSGVFESGIQFSPKSLDFGHVTDASSHSLLLHLVMNADLLKMGMYTQAVSSDSKLRVDLMPLSHAGNALPLSLHTPVHQTYNLRLDSRVPAGFLNDHLYLTFRAKAGSPLAKVLSHSSPTSSSSASSFTAKSMGSKEMPSPIALVIIPITGDVVKASSGTASLIKVRS